MRHAFSFPPEARNTVRDFVRHAVDGLSPTRFAQEPAYIAALLAKLDGFSYQGADGTSVLITTTNVNSIGRGAAENWSGADLVITADIRRGDLRVRKAILAQAKLGGKVQLYAYRTRSFTARVTSVQPAADPTTQRYTVVLEMENRAGQSDGGNDRAK